jgi:hypothetical protein
VRPCLEAVVLLAPEAALSLDRSDPPDGAVAVALEELAKARRRPRRLGSGWAANVSAGVCTASAGRQDVTAPACGMYSQTCARHKATMESGQAPW